MTDAPGTPSFGDLLRLFRRRAGLSQVALAQQAEVNARSIKYLESGGRQPYPETVRRLAAALKLSETERHQLATAGPSPEHRRAPRLAGEAPQSTPPTPAPEPSRRHNLPATLTRMLGREAALAEVHALLEGARLVTLIGPGGIGKTLLATVAATERAATYSDGAWFVDLAGVVDPALVPAAVAGVLDRRRQRARPGHAAAAWAGVAERREEGDRPPAVWLVDALQYRHLLVVLDNCEHLIEACAALADRVIRACTGVQILATSREALGASGEHIYRLLPLPVPGLNVGLLDPRREPAMQLFVERARAASGFALTPENAGAVAEICRRLDGIPLAIELAAGRTSLLTADEITARLDDRFRLLAANVRTAPQRHQTLRAIVTWSYDLAGESQRRLFERLAVFTGGWTLAAAEAVCSGKLTENGSGALTGDSVLAVGDILDLHGTLVGQSLVASEHDGAETRYRLLETLRQYAAERLAERYDADATWRQHADYFARFAERAERGLRGAEQARWMSRLVREHDNLEGALRWSSSHGEAELALRLVGALSRYWYTRARGVDQSHWYDRVLALDATGVAAETSAKVLVGATMRSLLRGDLDDAGRESDASLELYGPLGDAFDHARAIMHRGLVAAAAGDHDRATDLLADGLGMFRRVGSRWGEGLVLGHLSVLASGANDAAMAEQFLAASILAFRETGDAFELATGLARLGDSALRYGDVERARAYYEESLAQYRDAGMPRGDPILLHNQACVLRQHGESTRAALLFQEALVLYRDRAEPAGIAHCLLGLADLAVAADNTTLAARLLGTADSLPRRLPRGWVWPGDRGAYEPLVALTRSELGETAFEAAFAEGRALAPEQALAEATVLHDDDEAPTRLRPRRQMA